MVVAEARGPARELRVQLGANVQARLELGGMPQRVVEPDRLDMRIAAQRPRQTDGRILAAGKQHESAARVGHRTMMPALLAPAIQERRSCVRSVTPRRRAL